ncbi:hypothetical protein ABXS75_18855 [Roseburia hominis]
MKIKVTNNAKIDERFAIEVPENISLFQFHAVLEIALDVVPGAHFCFMLMSERKSIEDVTADRYKLSTAFSQNSVIRYLNPYPGDRIYLLELQRTEKEGKTKYPIVSGTKEDKQINEWLKKYCMFAKDWKYCNMNLHQGKKSGESLCGKAAVKETGRNTGRIKEDPDAMYRFRTMQEKQDVLYGLSKQYTGSVRVTVKNSTYSQAEILSTTKKDSLCDYCNYAGLHIKKAWKKKKIAESFSTNLQENIWLTMVLLPEEAIELYFRLCKVGENQKISLDLYKVEASLSLFLYLGIMDIVLQTGSPSFAIELPGDFKKRFMEMFRGTTKFDRASEAAVYLSPELKVGGWQKIVKGYQKLDERVSWLLTYYGIMNAEDLCTKLRECYQYSFSQEEFMRYLMLHMRLPGKVYTATNSKTGERYVALAGVDIEYAFAIWQKSGIKVQPKPISREILESFEEKFPEMLNALAILLTDFVADKDMIEVIVEALVNSVAGNEKWEEFLEILAEVLIDSGDMDYAAFWYQLSKIYLSFPVSGLGGYSRIEFAQREYIENPFEVLNEQEEYLIFGEDEIWAKPFDVQWELYRDCEQFMEEGSIFAERKMMKCARKHLGKEMAEGLQMYCYVLMGNFNLPDLLRRLATNGNSEARELLVDLGLEQS